MSRRRPTRVLPHGRLARSGIGYAAAHTESGEMFLLLVDPAHAARSVSLSFAACPCASCVKTF
jgi:hypothetical protein